MANLRLDRRWFPALCLAASMACAYADVTEDGDRHPVFNTGVGATILYPGQSTAMPPVHPGHRLPAGAPMPNQPAAPGPQGQPLPAPAPAGPGTIGGAPSYSVQQGPGSSSGSSSGGGITFIGGAQVDEEVYTQVHQEPRWLKYLMAPVAIAAYPFVAVYDAVTGDDGPPPAPPAPEPEAPLFSPPAPADAQTQYEQSQLEALESELASQHAGQPGVNPPGGPAPAPRMARPAPTGSSISSELEALQRGIPPRIPGGASTVEEAPGARSEPQPSGARAQARSARSEPQASGARAEARSASAAPQPSETDSRGGVADQVTDRNGDGRPDHWIYRRSGQLVRELFDENADGAPDRYVFYEPATGEKNREEEDTDLDGQIDSWIEYQNGQTTRHRRDSNADGVLDTWSFYRGGELSRLEEDRNADGFRDRVGFYQAGLLAREEEDRNGDGQPDRVTLFDEQERIRQRDDDQNGDGVVDLRSFYSEGRLVRRELLEEEQSKELIEQEDLPSTAWSGGGEVE